jgi:hypothetical protein
MTESTIVTDATEIVLQQELQAIDDELERVRQRMRDLEREQRAAQDAEGVAMERAGALHAVSDPLVLGARTEESRYGIIINDLHWRQHQPEAARALDQAQAADQEARTAGVVVHKLSKEQEDIQWRLLPRLNGARDAKAAELERHRQSQQRALEQTRSAAHIERFKARLRGEA